MKSLRWRDLLACSALVLAGCARSSVQDPEPELSGTDSGVQGAPGGATGKRDAAAAERPAPGDADDGLDESDEPASIPQPPRSDAGLARDAGLEKVDAGGATPDAGGTTTPPSAPPPASPPVGTPSPDSGLAQSVPDAGAGTPSASKMCKVNSDCKQSCALVGILACCRDNGSCGCTWAPGSYCR